MNGNPRMFIAGVEIQTTGKTRSYGRHELRYKVALQYGVNNNERAEQNVTLMREGKVLS